MCQKRRNTSGIAKIKGSRLWTTCISELYCTYVSSTCSLAHKQSYKKYWRVKITIMNLNLHKNYTSWNLVIEHPNLSHLVESFSFHYMPMTMDRPINNTGLFWGIQSFNDVLMQAGQSGNVHSEMLLGRVPGTFTFQAGWAFPKRVYFNGENCVMPLPEDFPRLPRRNHVFGN